MRVIASFGVCLRLPFMPKGPEGYLRTSHTALQPPS